jgi:hypothetical protein
MRGLFLVNLFLLASTLAGMPAAAAPKDVLNCKRYDTGVVDTSAIEAIDRKVILHQFDDGEIREARMANASAILEDSVTRVLDRAGVEVDRELMSNSDVRDSIEFLEQLGRSEFSTTIPTDVISAKVTSVKVSSSFVESKKGKFSPYCFHTAKLEGVLHIYDVKTLKLSAAIELSESESVKVEGNNRNCRLPDAQVADLVAIALDEAVKKDASAKMYSMFRRAGYVREVRMCGKTPYVWISTPPSRGATPKSKVKIFEQEQYVDPITREAINRKRFVVEGKIVETQNPDEAWMRLKSKKEAAKVRIGHLAEIEQAGPSVLCTVLDSC